MKKTIILSLLIAFAAASFGQQVPASSTAPTQTDYLKKSKRQKTWAWITTGVAALSLNVAIGNNGYPAQTTTAYVIGCAFVATSIVLFNASGKNKKKANAASVFIDIKKAPMLQETVIRNQSFPAVGVRIGL